MFAQDIIINTKTYSLRSQRATSSVRSDATRSITAPKTVTISHEVAKSARVSSAVMIDDKVVVTSAAGVTSSDTIRALLKIQYNPYSGRTTTNADIKAAIADLVAFLGVTANVDKIINQES